MFVWILIWAVVFGTLAGEVTNSKGRGWGEGLVLGGLLGILGLIIVAFLQADHDTAAAGAQAVGNHAAVARLVSGRRARAAVVEWFSVDRRPSSTVVGVMPDEDENLDIGRINCLF